MIMPSLYENLGGEKTLAKIIDAFVDRCFADPMIGFLFASADRKRIKAMEFQHAAEHLGADMKYEGRPIEKIHQAHPIREGHFNRRRQILSDVLQEFGVSSEIRTAWLDHQEQLKSQIVNHQHPIC